MPKLLNHLNIKTFNHLFAYLQISRFRHSVVAGVSLFEIIIVVGIFAIVAVLTTRATLLSLTGSRKSESGIKVKQNLENALSVIERAVKNADTVSTPCGVNPPRVDFTDSDGLSAYFSCEALQTSGYIASGSAKGITPLTGSEIVITDCSFTCTAQSGSNNPEVTVDVTAREAASSGAAGAEITTSTKILLRNY